MRGISRDLRAEPHESALNYSDTPAPEPLTEVRIRETTRVGKIKYYFCEGFVKEDLNSKKHGLENFWSMDFQSDLTFLLVNIF